MQPMAKRGIKIISMGGDLLRELTFKSWEDIVEGQGICAQVNPSGVSSKDSEGLTWPETIGRTPVSNIRLTLMHVSVETFQVAFPLEMTLISEDI